MQVHRFIKPGFQGSLELQNVTWQNESSCSMMRWSEKEFPSLEVIQRLWMEGQRFTYLGEFFLQTTEHHCPVKGEREGEEGFIDVLGLFSQLYDVPSAESM